MKGKMWDARFAKATDARVNDFNSSISFDWRMYHCDIAGSIAHATADVGDPVDQGVFGIFEVFTDMQGKKVPKVKKLVEFAPESDGGGFVSRAEFEELKQKFEAFTTKGE